MARKKTTEIYQGKVGNIDCVIDWPAGEAKGWALVLHPHPLQGGTRDNKVVTTISRSCVEHGLVAVRPNFRGVGASEGEFDNGVGETDDMLMLVQQFLENYPQLASGIWVLGGFSFGTSVGAQLYSTLVQQQKAAPDAVIFAGPAIERFKFTEVNLPDHTVLVHGENDDVVPLSESMDYARSNNLPVVVIPDSGHFFHGKLLILKGLVEQRLSAIR